MISHATKTPTDIITYRYNDKLVYVPVASDYTQALCHAREAFPQLKKQRDTSLSLCLTAPGHTQKFVGISAPAWPKLTAHMSRFQIIDVRVTPTRGDTLPESIPIPDITITYADVDDVQETEPVPPPYRGPGAVDDEKASCSHPSSTLQHGKRNWLSQVLHGNVFHAS